MTLDRSVLQQSLVEGKKNILFFKSLFYSLISNFPARKKDPDSFIVIFFSPCTFHKSSSWPYYNLLVHHDAYGRESFGENGGCWKLPC